jgi:hypothetical protein
LFVLDVVFLIICRLIMLVETHHRAVASDHGF